MDPDGYDEDYGHEGSPDVVEVRNMAALDPLLRVTSRALARRWIDSVFESASRDAVVRMARAFADGTAPGFMTMPAGAAQKGGAVASMEELDERLSKLFELRDSLHDFPNHAGRVSAAVGLTEAELPFVGPRQMTFESVANYKRFTDDITKNGTLAFPRADGKVDRVDNPLQGMDHRMVEFAHPKFTGILTYGATLLSEYEKHKLRAVRFDDPRVPVGATFQSSEVWTLRTPDAETGVIAHEEPQLIQMTQIATACGMLKARFSESACFVLDANELLPRLLVAYEHMGAELLAKFKSVDDMEVLQIVAECTSNQWAAVRCDATLADSATHVGVTDARETGLVTHPRSRIRVTLGGCPTESSYRYVAETDDFSDPVMYSNLDHFNTRKTVSEKRWNGFVEKYSKAETVAILQAAHSAPGNIARYLALKRAGDWGQVVYCRNRGAVFVTTDKPAFMHAVMLDACAWLVIVDNNYIKSGYVLYTFVVYTSDRARSSLMAVGDVHRPGTARGGGTVRMTYLAAAASVAVIGASLMAP
jgi:hypothetical protein